MDEQYRDIENHTLIQKRNMLQQSHWHLYEILYYCGSLKVKQIAEKYAHLSGESKSYCTTSKITGLLITMENNGFVRRNRTDIVRTANYSQTVTFWNIADRLPNQSNFQRTKSKQMLLDRIYDLEQEVKKLEFSDKSFRKKKYKFDELRNRIDSQYKHIYELEEILNTIIKCLPNKEWPLFSKSLKDRFKDVQSRHDLTFHKIGIKD
jgi:hypothetical protein